MPIIESKGAGSAQGFGEFAQSNAVNYIENVFSTYLYTGTGSPFTINNGIDLSGKGGMVWSKARNAGFTTNHGIIDTTRGNRAEIYPNLTGAQDVAPDDTYGITGFNSTGYGVGLSYAFSINSASVNYVSWTFRKQPKFFDIQTFTADGSGNATFSHSLGSTPGCIFIKNTGATENWYVYHTSLGTSKYLILNSTSAQLTSTNWITVSSTSVTATGLIASNNYVAYIYASNAGGFGLTGTDNVITCGSYTTNSGGVGSATLGYEPQFLLIKTSSVANDWYVIDNMRGLSVAVNSKCLFPNLANQESNLGIAPTATGFVDNGAIAGNATMIYIAIRRGPMAVPTDATKVFSPNLSSSLGGTITTNFPVDLSIDTGRAGASDRVALDRLRGDSTNSYVQLKTNTTDAEASGSGNGIGLDNNTGFINNWTSSSTIWWNFARAPSFFDEVCYTEPSSLAMTSHNHNLGVTPELLILKSRTHSGTDWLVWHNSFTSSQYLILDTTAAIASYSNLWGTMSSTVFSVFNVAAFANDNIVAYLFATCPGVSKVGSYTGNGTTQAIACGFTGGARFVLIKRTDSTGDWYVYDTARGMSTLTDPYLLLDSTAAETATLGSVTTTTGGFTVNASVLSAINTSGGSYIFLAIS